MHPATLVTLNMRELDRLKVIQAVMDRVLKPGRAAERLSLTVRQIERLVIRYRESGAAAIVTLPFRLPFCATELLCVVSLWSRLPYETPMSPTSPVPNGYPDGTCCCPPYPPTWGW